MIGTDPLHSMPILDLRIRKAVRRNGARLAVATDRPTALDGGAEETARYAPGFSGGFVTALAGAVGAEGHERASGELGADAERIAGVLKPDSTVIVWAGEAGRALVDCARMLKAKLLEVPDGANSRGLREVGCLSDRRARPLRGVRGPRRGSGSGTASLTGASRPRSCSMRIPSATSPGGPAWSEALTKAKFVLAVAMFENATTRHADVVFPAEFYAEKEGTVTHPDGRLQRLRPGVPRPGGVRPIWQVLVGALRAARRRDGYRLGARGARGDRVRGSLLRRHHPRGDRRAGRPLAGARRGPPLSRHRPRGRDGVPGAGWRPRRQLRNPPAAEGEASGGAVQIGTYRDLWAAEVTDRSPALRFLAPRQTLDLAPADADRLGLAQGDEVDVRSNGTSLRARVAIRERVRPGSGFLIEGTAEANANALEPGELVEVTKAGEES